MKINIKSHKQLPTFFLENIQNELENVWADSTTAFFAKYVALNQTPQKQPKGVQAFINVCLEETLNSFGWEGEDGRFVKDGVWLRITFRNQMSIGTDFMDALLLAHRENVQALIIAAPSLDFARIITPGDANTIVSYEKLEDYYTRAHTLFQIPIGIGRLEASENINPEIQKVLNSRI